MLKILIISLITTFLFSYEDLGTYGKTMPIKERDLMELFYEKASKLDYKKIENEVKENIYKSLNIKSSIQNCTKNQVRIFEPVNFVNQDIKVPFANVVLKKKGEKYNILKENNLFIPYNMIFIDADDEIQVELAKLYKLQLGSKIRVFVAKGDYFKLLEDPIFKEAQVSREYMESKAFNLKCLPSIYAQKKYKFQITEYNPEKIKKDENE